MVLIAAALVAIAAALLWWRWPREIAKAPAKVATQTERQVPERAAAATNAAPVEVEIAQPITLSPATVQAAPDAPAGELAGRVLNWGDGSPVAGAEVTIAGATGAASFVTDAQGRFVARPSEAGKHRIVSAFAAGFLPWAPDPDRSPLELWSRPGLRIDGVVLYLVPALTYHGTVVDPDGAPVPDAAVTMLDAAWGERAAAPIDDTFTAGADGRFEFHAPDDALFEARAPGFAPGRARLDGPAQVSHELRIVLGARDGAAAAPLAITGRVVDRQGAPIAGTRVTADPADHLGVSGEAIADASGAFALAALDPGPHAVRADADGFATAAIVAEAGAVEVVITLDDGARIIGRVLDPTGKPVPAPTVVVQQRVGLASRAVAVVSVFDAEGRFSIDGLAADTYEVVAQAAGFAPSAPSTAVAEADPDDVIVTLRKGATLVGTLIDGDTRAPLENGKITVEGGVGDGSSAVPVMTTAISRADGTFELAGIAPGRRSMTAGAFAHHMAIVGPFELADGERIGPVAVELTPLGPGETPQIELAGIGAKLSAQGDVLRVDGLIAGGGAEQAGILAGDHLLAIDGTSVTELGMDGSIQRIRGPVGTVVRLRVQRGDAAASEIAVTRTKIRA